MFKQALAIVALAALTACGGGGGGEPAPVAAAPVAPPAAPVAPAPAPVCTIEINGDSIPLGAGVEVGMAVTLRQIRPMWTVIDKSVGGMTSVRRATEFFNENRTARVIVLQYGVNDAYQKLAVAEMDAALKAMALYSKSEGRTVIFTGMSRTSIPGASVYAAAVKQAADDTGSVYADWPSVEGVLQADEIHPAQQMSNDLAAKLALSMDAVAPECR